MRCIIAGSRTASREDVRAAVLACPFGDEVQVVVSGTARGADRFGEELAAEAGVPVTRFPADWDRYGRRAGILRNTVMAQNADALIAVWDGISPGTRHMISEAKRLGLRVFVYRGAPL